jgi:hypothetical protein
VANVVTPLSWPFPIPANVYNMEERGGHAARFAFNVAGAAIVNIDADLVNVGGVYRIRTSINQVSQLLPVVATELTLWGVPADHNGSGAPRTAFLRNPTRCGGPLTTTLNISQWTAPNEFLTAESTTASGPVGCDQIPFEPSITVTPDTSQADTPTGLRVDINVPQSDDPEDLATGHLDDAVVTLPDGMSISPGLASGLEVCSDATRPPTVPTARRSERSRSRRRCWRTRSRARSSSTRRSRVTRTGCSSSAMGPASR